MAAIELDPYLMRLHCFIMFITGPMENMKYIIVAGKLRMNVLNTKSAIVLAENMCLTNRPCQFVHNHGGNTPP